MAEHLFLEIGDFYAHCEAFEPHPGLWKASVLFERKADHVNTFVQGLRHKIQADFPDRNAAISAAGSYAHDCVAKGKTGL